MDSDVANILNGNLASSSQLSHQRTNVIGESLTQGLGTIQNLGIQYTNSAAVSSTLMADDPQALARLRTADRVPNAATNTGS